MTGLCPIGISSQELQVSVLTRGATLAAVRLGRDPRNLVLGFADLRDHLDVPIYAGALVGPVANRVARGQIHLNGERHQMTLNENGRTALHSGPEGLHAKDWRVCFQSETQVDLAVSLQDGDQGLPGTREITASYKISGRTLSLDITATTDRPTPMNIAAHPYWNLDGHHDISGHQLQVSAAQYLPTDAGNIPTGRLEPTAGGAFDFTSLRTVPLTPELDVNFCLAERARDIPQPCATLIGRTGTKLEIATTAPGLQVYAGAFIPELAARRDDGGDLAPYAAIALEPQCWPDAPNHPHFPQITLQPGEIWRQTTHYHLTPAP